MANRFLATAVLGAMITTAPQPGVAQNYPWCLVNDQKGSTSCAFVSREQCMLSTGGNVGHCIANPALPSVPEPARRSRGPGG